MKKIKVGVIFGGASSEHYVSVVSATSVIKNMNKKKYDIYPIYIDLTGKFHKYVKEVGKIEILDINEIPVELESIPNIGTYLKKLDIVLPILHGAYGEDGCIQGLLEMYDIPYVGCNVISSSMCMNKMYTKLILNNTFIKQAPCIMLNVTNNKYTLIDEYLNHTKISLKKVDTKIKEKLGYPVFIKPASSGSSVGVNKARNIKELAHFLSIASEYDKEIIIEKEIIGKEVECAILNGVPSSVGEVLSSDEFYSFDAKYINNESVTLIPADLEKEVSNKIKEQAVLAFNALKCKGIARIDFFVTTENEIYLNEINTMPGFTSISMYPKLWEHDGISYTRLIDKLIESELN